MRSVLALLVVVGGVSVVPRDASACEFMAGLQPVAITVGRDALDAVIAVAEQRSAEIRILDLDADAIALELAEIDLPRLAEEIHARHGRCGGFMVHDTAAAAVAALPVHLRSNGVPYQPGSALRPELDYPIDRPAVVGAALPALDAARIRDTIRELSAMKNRYYQSETGAAASRWLAARWRGLSVRPDVTVELVDHGYPQSSVVMTIPGQVHPDEVIVIGGHLDSIAAGGVSSTAPGADDDASGVATLTEVARVLLAADYRPARTIQFMAYAAEEIGLRGSQAIVRDYQQRGVRVIGALQLDMTNYQGSDKDIWLMKDFTSAAQNAFLVQLIERYVGATWGMDACGYACSDHASWFRAGVPASMPFESRSRDRNRAIHTRRDTLETSSSNAAHAVKFARLAAAYAIELGKGELGFAAESSVVVRAAAPSPGSPGHPGAAACIALFVLGLWLARAAADRIG
jgi:leucyl aminopeptidase